ncbi:hypothetical protein ABT158_42000 [Nonomuraea sp. NPDC001636]|uniref:hypothetical protein n=1 Tax=Nonomuraea sp. NPDC001636 TaxID=3154391 RepID=UPI00333458BE
MTRSLLLVSLAAGSLTAPVPAYPAATELAIRAITVRPANPVVGAHDSVSLVIDVIARGARGKNGVTVKVEPGAPPGPLLSAKPPVEDASDLPPAAEPGLQPPALPGPPSPSSSWTPGTSSAPAESTESAGPAESAGPSGSSAAPVGPAGAAPGSAYANPASGGPVEGLRALMPLPLTVAAQPVAAQPVGAQPGIDLQKAPSTGALPPRLVWRQGATPPARMAADWQTWRFLPDKKLNRFYPTGTWTISATARDADGATVTEYASFELRRATRLSSVRVERSPKSAAGVRLRGSLTRIDPRGFTDFGPYAKQRLRLQWRGEGSPAWEDVAETTTDAAGAFVQTVPPRRGGLWRVHFPGNPHYAPYTTKPRQIAS